MDLLNTFYVLFQLFVFTYALGYDQRFNGDVVDIQQSPGNGHEKFPPRYAVWFTYRGDPQYNDLTLDSELTDALSPELMSHSPYFPSGLMTEGNMQDFAVYHNGEEVSSPSRVQFILHRPTIDDDARLYGEVNIDGEKHRIMYTSSQHRGPMYKREANTGSHRIARALPVDSLDNILELFVYVVPDLFQYQKARLGTDNTATETWLSTVFVPAITRDLDKTFQTITTTKLRIYYAGYADNKGTGTSWFSDNYQDPYLNGYQALVDVNSTLNNKLTNAGVTVDYTLFLTRADIAVSTSGSKSWKQADVYDYTICGGPYNGAERGIAEVNSGLYRKAMAQAIAFGFGLKVNQNSYRFLIMQRDTDVFPIPAVNASDPWMFSMRNQESINNTIASSTKCMLTQDAATDFASFISSYSPVGGTFTLEEQCQVFINSTASICNGTSDADELCYANVECSVGGVCDYPLIAGDRSECDAASGRVCRYGDCVQGVNTTSSSTSTTPALASSSPLASSTPGTLDCCCELRPLGKVNIDIEYVPCP